MFSLRFWQNFLNTFRTTNLIVAYAPRIELINASQCFWIKSLSNKYSIEQKVEVLA